ncbi:hypothetical protein ACE1SV_71000 [Streptomyces sennicomposti]
MRSNANSEAWGMQDVLVALSVPPLAQVTGLLEDGDDGPDGSLEHPGERPGSRSTSTHR